MLLAVLLIALPVVMTVLAVIPSHTEDRQRNLYTATACLWLATFALIIARSYHP